MVVEPTTRLDPPAASPARTLVLGLGNPVLTDDSVGLRVVRLLRSRLAGHSAVEVEEDYRGGLRLMERMIGFARAIVVDAICSGAEPGTVRVVGADTLVSRHCACNHDVDLRTAIELGRQTGWPLPTMENIRLVAIEAGDVLTFSEECTPPVQASIGRAAEAVLALVAWWR